MSNTIKPKRSAVAGKVPLATDLVIGEIAINTADGVLYARHSDGSVKAFVPATAPSVTRSITASYVVAASDSVIFASAATGALTVTLPSAVGNQGRLLIVKKTDVTSNAVTLTTSGGTIDGGASAVLSSPYMSLSLVSDGTNWQVI